MDFTVNAASMQKVVKALVVVVKSSAEDSTGNILIEASDHEVLFTANNGSVSISFNVTEVEVNTPGAVALTYSKIKSFIASFKVWDGKAGVKSFRFISAERITKLMVENFGADGKTSRGELKLTNSNPALINKASNFSNPSFVLNSTIFRAALDKVLYAIKPQTDFSQPALQGMSVRFEKDNIFFAGSDGVVLSEYQVKNVSEFNNGNILLQYDFIMGLRRLLTDDIPLLWEVKGNKVNVKFNEILYSGRLIIGHEFPEYSVSLMSFTDYININKASLIDSICPIIDVLEPEDNCRLTLEIKDKTLSIYNNQARIESDLGIQGGLNFSVDLNGKFFLQTIEAIKDDYILLKFSNSKAPIIVDSSTFNDQKAIISSIKKR